jgi:hypothetical protein
MPTPTGSGDYHWSARALAAEAELEQARAELELLRGARTITPEDPVLPELDKVDRLLRKTVTALPRDEARFLVQLYYQLQEHRIATGNQASHGNELLNHYHSQIARLEKSLPPLLGKWADQDPAGAWAHAQYGIGPVLAAGLVAHIDFTKFEGRNLSSLWSFAGYNPDAEWKKGQKRPWNAELKVHMWKIGQSFVMFHKRPECLYGQLYASRKAVELARNENGAQAAAAAKVLATRNIREPKTLAIYTSGKLPAGHLDAKARRYAVKRFMSHYFTVGWEAHYGTPTPKPYVQEYLGHHDIITPPPPYTPLPQS